tara:strand:+ start:7141 stop:7692 length:552 start_codon:yes stop_codon:yes gene_type:complete
MEYQDQSAHNLKLHVVEGEGKPVSTGLNSVSLHSENIQVFGTIIGASHYVQVLVDGACILTEMIACCELEEELSEPIEHVVELDTPFNGVYKEVDNDLVSYETEIQFKSVVKQTQIMKEFATVRPIESSSWYAFPTTNGEVSAKTGLKLWKDDLDSNVIHIETIHEYLEENIIVTSKTLINIK